MQSFPSQQDSINGDLLSTMEIQQLIRQCQQGDAEALGALYQTYAQRMRGVCRRYICDEQAVDDVLHDAFVIIFTSFDRLRDPQKAEAWMLAIVRMWHQKTKPISPLFRVFPLKKPMCKATFRRSRKTSGAFRWKTSCR